MADVKLAESNRVTVDGWDSDGSLSWEDFFGSNTEDLVPTLIEMYDVLIGRAPPKTQEVVPAKDPVKSSIFDRNLNWSNRIERSWNCRCTGKSGSKAITRCAACNADPEIRSTDIRDSKVLNVDVVSSYPVPATGLGQTCVIRDRDDPDRKKPVVNVFPLSDIVSDINSNCRSVPNLGKCELVTCPAGFSTPSTPVQQRLSLLPSRSPLALKRARGENGLIHRSESDFLCVPRPLSVSSIASSSSSSSGTSSCSGVRRLGVPHKSSAYLASIESLEDDSDSEGRLQKSETCRLDRFKCNGSQGSEDSGVHSPCSYISSPSPPQGRPRYCDPHLSYMDRVVMEIVETEGVYVRDLQRIIEGYLLKWRSLPDFPLADRLDDLFSNIEDIYHFNSKFLRELEQCGLDPVKVAQCFVRNNVGFSIYTEYCTNYPRTVSSLTELMRQEGTVRLFRERQTALQHTLPLGSYLLKPVQRILKYHLLLQNIVKQYSNSNEGYKDIVDALSTMTGIAQHINEMKRKHEHAVRVQEIQSLLYGWEGEDLTTFGELCAEGTFRMSGAKALRHVFLFDKMVLITKKKEEAILGYKAHINCSNLMLIESVPGEPLSFHAIPFDNPRLQYTLQARNLEQKREWTLQLKRVILENYNAVIPSHARQLVMELGQNRTDDEIMADKSLPKRQHSAPEYLEKRKQDRRKSETGLKSRLRRGRKSDAGSNTKSQFDKDRSRNQGTPETKNYKLGSWRRKSEPGIYSTVKDSETEDTCSVMEESIAEERKPDDTPEKISIDLNDVEEVKTLEQIVGQLLMQNREFDKILKKQQHHVSSQNRSLSNGKILKNDTTDDEDDGVYETLMNVKLVLGTQQQDYDTDYNSDPDYVTLVCGSRLKKQSSLKECSKNSTIVRRTRSFHNADETSLKIAALGGVSIPTSPSVWLRQQGQHLAIPTNKAGSLPRSFQINAESTTDDPRCFRDFRVSIERPFTIASDKPTPGMLFEDYCLSEKPHFCDTTEDESLTEGLSTPGASSDHINVHPEYKIYRSGVSASVLKNVLSSVGNKLSHMKIDMTPKSEYDKRKALQRERKASRVLYVIAKHYHKSLKSKIKSGKDLWEGPKPALPVYKQGSSSLGARLANSSDAESRVNRVRPSRKAAAVLGVRPDSVLSLASTFTSSSEGNDGCAITKRLDMCDTKSMCHDDSEGSTDSIYERSFEAMDEETSGVNSELEDSFALETEPKNSKDSILLADNTIKSKVPPPVPVKPKRKHVLPVEAEVRMTRKTACEAETRREEEGDTSSQHSTASTVIEVSTENGSTRPRGWVRHIVGKLQGGI